MSRFILPLPLAQLHWLIADKTGCITVEATHDGLHIYDNPTGVLTNNPPFPMQLFNLNNYMALSAKSPENTFAPDVPLATYSRGMGAMGLPGDLSSQSRFVRVAFVRAHSLCKPTEESSVSQFFHILHSVEQQRGCCELDGGKYEITLYTSCCNATRDLLIYDLRKQPDYRCGYAQRKPRFRQAYPLPRDSVAEHPEQIFSVFKQPDEFPRQAGAK